jgi:hypothetical protein
MLEFSQAFLWGSRQVGRWTMLYQFNCSTAKLTLLHIQQHVQDIHKVWHRFIIFIWQEVVQNESLKL